MHCLRSIVQFRYRLLLWFSSCSDIPVNRLTTSSNRCIYAKSQMISLLISAALIIPYYNRKFWFQPFPAFLSLTSLFELNIRCKQEKTIHVSQIATKQIENSNFIFLVSDARNCLWIHVESQHLYICQNQESADHLAFII